MWTKIKFLLISALIFSAVLSAFYYLEINSSKNRNGTEQTFSIQIGESARTIGDKLKNDGIINSSFYFYLYSLNQGIGKDFKAGDYLISPKLNIKEITKIFTDGQIISNEINLTFKEGWTARDMADYINKNQSKKGDEFLKLTQTQIKNWPFDFPKPEFLNDAPEDANLEGYLFPDTYRIYQKGSAQNIIQKMLYNFDKKLTDETRTKIKAQGKTIHEIVIMSSIVEKEVQAINDMRLIAGIFYNRLNSNMKLDSDATLTYALNDKIAAHTYDDLQNDTPYNTYKFKGLPPGPISNPGLSALQSAVNPQKSDYYYFLTGTDNKTYFAKTYDDHLKNKASHMK